MLNFTIDFLPYAFTFIFDSVLVQNVLYNVSESRKRSRNSLASFLQALFWSRKFILTEILSINIVKRLFFFLFLETYAASLMKPHNISCILVKVYEVIWFCCCRFQKSIQIYRDCFQLKEVQHVFCGREVGRCYCVCMWTQVSNKTTILDFYSAVWWGMFCVRLCILTQFTSVLGHFNWI